MIVACTQCGALVDRTHPRQHNFCCVAHRNDWMREHVDFAELARLHHAKHLTELNYKRNPLCRVADRGAADSRRSRKVAEAYIGRRLKPDEVVHHMNGDATDERHENLLIMTDREHKQLHMALAIEQFERGEHDAEK